MYRTALVLTIKMLKIQTYFELFELLLHFNVNVTLLHKTRFWKLITVVAFDVKLVTQLQVAAYSKSYLV